MLSHNNRRLLDVVLFVSIFAVCLIPLFAQDSATPTPAPSKTPTLSPALTATLQPEATPLNTELAQPFTQADLSVVTGNTQRPNGVAWYDGKLYTVCTGDWTVYEIEAATGTTAQYIYGVRNAHTLYPATEDGRLSLWIPDFQTNQLVKIERGTPNPVVSDLKGPWGITSISDTEFAITNLLDHTVTLAGRDGTKRALLVDLRSPTGIAVDENRIYIANTGSSRRAIEWFDKQQVLESQTPLSAQDKTIGHPLVTGLQNTTNITLAADGYLYFAYALGTRGVVARVNPETCVEKGGCSHEQVEIVIYTELNAPLAGLAISPDMRLYIHTIFSPDIYWVQLGSAPTN